MNILITGGTGFLGGKIANFFQSLGHDVTITTREKKSESFPHSGLHTVKISDFFDVKSISKLCKGQDIVIHAAGMNANDSVADPLLALKFNGLGTAQMAREAANNGVAKFFFLSTAHVYKDPLFGFINEETCIKNNHPYAFSKRVGEQAVLIEQQKSVMEGIVLRLSNIFGAPMHSDVNVWSLLVNDLCRQVVTSGKMILHTSGKQYRDFLPIRSFLHMLSKMMYLNTKSFQDPIFNIGSGNATMIMDMALLIKDRYEVLFKKKVTLQVPSGSGEGVDQLEKLSFSVERIKKLGVFYMTDPINEIDEILFFCRRNFL